MNLVMVRHFLVSSDNLYIFFVPDNQMLKKGDMVMCETKYGTQPGICACDNFVLSGSILDSVLEGMGVKKPLKPIVSICKIIPFNIDGSFATRDTPEKEVPKIESKNKKVTKKSFQ